MEASTTNDPVVLEAMEEGIFTSAPDEAEVDHTFSARSSRNRRPADG